MALFILPTNDFGIPIDIVTFDVTVTEQHEEVSIPTEYPVEDGVAVTDHVHHMQPIVTAEVFVSNTPNNVRLGGPVGRIAPMFLELPIPFEPQKVFPGVAIALPGAGTLTAIAGFQGRLTPPVLFPWVMQFDAFDAVGDTYLKLLLLKLIAQKLTLLTSLTQYDNMILTGLSTPRTVADGTGGRFMLTFKRIRKVVAGVVAAPEVPAEPNGQSAGTRGGKSTLPAADADAAGKKALKSMAASLVDAGGF